MALIKPNTTFAPCIAHQIKYKVTKYSIQIYDSNLTQKIQKVNLK
jgi:hypothetical protein